MDALLGLIALLLGTIEFMFNAGWVWWLGVLLLVAGIVVSVCAVHTRFWRGW
jgi:hypothetical protein